MIKILSHFISWSMLHPCHSQQNQTPISVFQIKISPLYLTPPSKPNCHLFFPISTHFCCHSQTWAFPLATQNCYCPRCLCSCYPYWASSGNSSPSSCATWASTISSNPTLPGRRSSRNCSPCRRCSSGKSCPW